MAISDFFNIPVCAEIAALATALLVLSNKAAGRWRLFIVFLLITVGIEGIGFYLKKTQPVSVENSIVYNVFMLVQMSFFCFLFYSFQKVKSVQISILLIFALFIIFFALEAVAKADNKPLLQTYQDQSRLLLSIATVLLSCMFFFYLLRTDGIKNPIAYPSFWIVTGLFFYYFGSIVLFAFRKEVRALRLSGNQLLFELITGSLSIILYGTWIIGFVCKKKEKR